jgi:signal transduction histidine kinase
MLRVYEELLVALGDALLQARYQAHAEAQRRAERDRAEQALRRANDELERRVEERTADLKEAQKKALQAERLAAVGQMVAGLAHESRNALQRISGGLERLRFRLQDRPECLGLLDNVRRAEVDLHGLFVDVRDYGAPIHLERCACNLADVWREAWADLEADRGGSQAVLSEEIAGADLRCVASPSHLKQVFRNLLDNALAAGGRHVVMGCSQAELEGHRAVQIAVRDDGPGLTPEQKGKLFEPFYTTKMRGTGLGLAICRRIMEAHGGRIAAADTPPPGAVFLLTLPRGGGE